MSQPYDLPEPIRYPGEPVPITEWEFEDARARYRASLNPLDVSDEIEDDIVALLKEPEPNALAIGRLLLGKVNAKLDRLARAEFGL